MTKEECLDYLGITKWHKAGYKGQEIKIIGGELTTDNFRSIHTDKLKDIIRPCGFGSGDNAQHGTDMFVHLLVVAPEATVVSCAKSKSIEYILKNDADIYVTALVSRQKLKEEKEELMQKCIDKGCLFFISAGNYDEQGLAGESKSDKYWAIGGVEFINGKWQKPNISSVGPELDFVGIAKMLGLTGTSPIAYVFSGMCALVQQFFKEKVGRKLTRPEMERFIKDNCKDVNIEGFDNETGYGLFILPNPETIDVNKYIINENIYYGGFPEVRSDTIMRGIDKLHPDLQMCVNKFLDECKKQGLNVLITETLRTQEEQEALYAQGRTEPGNIVTNCKGYQSPHCWGVAFDFCRNVKGKEYDNSDNFFDKVGDIAKTIFDDTEYDLFWGGDFKTFVDKPHIEMIKYLPNNSTKWLINTYGTPEEFMKTWKNGDDKNMEEPSEWAKKAWEWACAKERKYFDGTNPKGTVTREMLAQVLYNLFAKDKE